MGGSEFGSLFFMARGFGPQAQRPRRSESHFRVRRHALNWDPESLCIALGLISFSVHNVLAFLKATAGVDRSSLGFRRPQSDDAFQTPWQRTLGIRFSNLDSIVFEEDVHRFSREEILAVYDEELEEGTSGQR